MFIGEAVERLRRIEGTQNLILNHLRTIIELLGTAQGEIMSQLDDLNAAISDVQSREKVATDHLAALANATAASLQNHPAASDLGPQIQAVRALADGLGKIDTGVTSATQQLAGGTATGVPPPAPTPPAPAGAISPPPGQTPVVGASGPAGANVTAGVGLPSTSGPATVAGGPVSTGPTTDSVTLTPATPSSTSPTTSAPGATAPGSPGPAADAAPQAPSSPTTSSGGDANAAHPLP